MTRPKTFPDGSLAERRSPSAAFVRMLDSYTQLSAKADAVVTELDNTTIPGVIRGPTRPDDSLVMMLQDFEPGDQGTNSDRES